MPHSTGSKKVNMCSTIKSGYLTVTGKNEEIRKNTRLYLPPTAIKPKINKKRFIYHSNRLRIKKTHPISGNYYPAAIVKKQETENQSASVPGAMAAGVGAAIALCAWAIKRKQQLKEVSKWAARNVWKTRGIIAGLTVISFSCAAIIGKLFYRSDIYLPENGFEIAATAFLAGVALYPAKKKNPVFEKNEYLKRKACNGLIACASAAMVLTASYSQKLAFAPEWNYPTRLVNAAAACIIPEKGIQQNDTPTVNQTVFEEDSKSMKVIRIIGAFLLIFLAVLAICLGVFYACVLMCNGQEGLALLCLFGGAMLATLFVIVAIKLLNKNYHKKNTK
jgi:hypothetical protein